MTVSTIGSVAEFDTNGVTTNYPFYFKFLANEDLVVTYVDPSGVSSTLNLGTHYTVNGAGNEQGGSIVTTTALAGPGQLIVSREMDPFQQTSLRNQGKFLAETHEDVFDRLTMLIQQGFSIFKRALVRPFGRDYFYAENRRIASVHDPVESQDAATKHSVEAYVASILETGQGPINNAANVVYVYPDGTARSVQSLATKNNSLLGSAGIGHNNGTVYDALTGHDSEIISLRTNTSTVNSSLNQLIDMHYGVLRGVGLIPAEPGGVITTTTTAAVPSGRVLNVVSTANIYPGQLICYVGTNSEYYSAVIQSKDNTTLTLRTDIERPIASGALVSSFYNDVSHPNGNGFKAIADYALRNVGRKYESVITWRSSDDYTTQGVLTINSVNTIAYENPGSSEYPSIGVTAGSVDAGIITPAYDLPAGNYLVRVSMSPTLTGTTDLVTVAIRESVAGFPNTIGVARGGGSTPTVIEVAFHKRPNSIFQVFITSPVVGHQFALSKIEVMRVHANVTDLNKGVHVCLGDSWFANPGIVARLQERLPRATIINKGVGGNRADQLWDRFEGDVAPYNPDYVWAMAGTNDVAQGYTMETYAYNMGIVSSKISQIGAEAIVFNCSVGSPVHPTLGDLLTPSRKYALQVVYLSESPDRTKPGAAKSKVHISFALSIPASSIRRVGVFPGTTMRAATIEKLLAVGQLGATTGNIRYGFGGSAAAPISEDLQSATLSTSVRTNLAVTKSNANERFLIIEVENSSASTLEVIGFVTASWIPL